MKKRGSEIIIIGAGASGLIAARELVKAGKKVIVLEARRRIGGRIYTFKNDKFKSNTEGGAEFVHGKLKQTLSLLKEYKLKRIPAKGKVWHVSETKTEKDKDIVTEHHRMLARKLNRIKRDLPVKEFLNRHFAHTQYNDMRNEVIGFVEGYESASIDKFSTMAFRDDWHDVEKWKQYRVEGGYGSLMESLAGDFKKNGGKIIFGSVVYKIAWKKQDVTVHCANGKQYKAEQTIIAVPLGLLQQNKIRFSPAMPDRTMALKELGYGDIIKIQLLFRTKFWETALMQTTLGKEMKKLFFLFSDESIPTWWTQHPAHEALLTGWFSGPPAKKSSSKSNTQLLNEALDSLANIFKMEKKVLRSKLKAWKVMNWTKDEFSLGSYSYATVNSEKYRTKAGKPEMNTLFFAGEHLGEPTGTVEAALYSGLKAANELLKIKDTKNDI